MAVYSRIALIEGSMQQAPDAARIRNLYTSNRFRNAVALAEGEGYRPFILSPRHGVLDLDEVREPYVETLEGKTTDELEAWAALVMNRLERFLDVGPGKLYIDVYATGLYAKQLGPHLAEIPNANIVYPSGTMSQFTRVV